MPVDQITAMRPLLGDLMASAPSASPWCVTLEIRGRPELWIQMGPDVFNAAYLEEGHPEARLERAGLRGALGELVAFEPKLYATFTLNDAAPDVLAELADSWFTKVLGAGHDYAVDIALEDLG